MSGESRFGVWCQPVTEVCEDIRKVVAKAIRERPELADEMRSAYQRLQQRYVDQSMASCEPTVDEVHETQLPRGANAKSSNTRKTGPAPIILPQSAAEFNCLEPAAKWDVMLFALAGAHDEGVAFRIIPALAEHEREGLVGMFHYEFEFSRFPGDPTDWFLTKDKGHDQLIGTRAARLMGEWLEWFAEKVAKAMDKPLAEIKQSLEPDPLCRVRDSLFAVCSRAERIARTAERLEAWYSHLKNPDPMYFYVETIGERASGLGLDPEWQDPAPRSEHLIRLEAIDATLTLRAAVDDAIAAVNKASSLMDGDGQPPDQRWTVQTIGELRSLRGTILQGHAPNVFPSAMPMIRAGVPEGIRERAKKISERMEMVKSVILANVGATPAKPPTQNRILQQIEKVEKLAASLEPEAIGRQVVHVVKESLGALASGHGEEQPKESTGKSGLPELGPRDLQIWKLRVVSGLKQSEIAKALNKEFPREKKWTQPRVSEAFKRAKAHADASGVTHLLPKGDRPNAPTMLDPSSLELGERTDGRASHLREKAKQMAKDS